MKRFLLLGIIALASSCVAGEESAFNSTDPFSVMSTIPTVQTETDKTANRSDEADNTEIAIEAAVPDAALSVPDSDVAAPSAISTPSSPHFYGISKDVYVRGHYRKNETYVRPHYRRRPFRR